MDIMWDVYIELMRRLQVVGYVSRILAVMDRGNRDETKASLGNNQTRGREPPGKSGGGYVVNTLHFLASGL